MKLPTAHRIVRSTFWIIVYVLLTLYVLKAVTTVIQDWNKGMKDWRLNRAIRRAWDRERLGY